MPGVAARTCTALFQPHLQMTVDRHGLRLGTCTVLASTRPALALLYVVDRHITPALHCSIAAACQSMKQAFHALPTRQVPFCKQRSCHDDPSM